MSNPLSQRTSGLRVVAILAFMGGVGGSAPNLASLAGELTGGLIHETPKYYLAYLLGTAIFFLLGMVSPFVLQEKRAHKAFITGVTFPALILSFITGAQIASDNGEDERSSIFVQRIYAQEPTSQNDTEGSADSIQKTNDGLPRPIVIKFKDISPSADREFIIKFSTPDKKTSISKTVSADAGTQLFWIPDNMSSAWITTKNSNQSKLRMVELTQLDEKEVAVIDVKSENNEWSGFWNALGLRHTKTNEVSGIAHVEQRDRYVDFFNEK